MPWQEVMMMMIHDLRSLTLACGPRVIFSVVVVVTKSLANLHCTTVVHQFGQIALAAAFSFILRLFTTLPSTQNYNCRCSSFLLVTRVGWWCCLHTVSRK